MLMRTKSATQGDKIEKERNGIKTLSVYSVAEASMDNSSGFNEQRATACMSFYRLLGEEAKRRQGCKI